VALRGFALGRKSWPAAFAVVGCAAGLVAGPAFGTTSGGAAAPEPPAGEAPVAPVATTPLAVAQLAPDGRTAIAPAGTPFAVQEAIGAANEIIGKPYRYGGGHNTFRDNAYDCSGSVSYALHGADLVGDPLDSSSLMQWGVRGRGDWITVYTKASHAYAVIAGLRFDTSGPGPRGPRWRSARRTSRGFVARHPFGL
jgi:cell wall-associated NlpC family hydrolase